METNCITIQPDSKDEFSYHTASVNIQRGKMFTIIIISIEIILLLIDMLSRSINTSFKFDWYAMMYILMISVTGITWVLLSWQDKNKDSSKSKIVNLIALGYVTFFMMWGTVISLGDQLLYGNIVVLLVNMLVGSLMFYIPNKRLLIPQILAAGFFIISLPYYQIDWQIRVGHYVNVSIFFVFSLVMARTNYSSYTQNYFNHKLIKEKSMQLENMNTSLLLEIDSRIRIQKELETANQQLMALSSIDPLTGIPNRRKLDEVLLEFWNRAMEKRIALSILMIDIDFFKNYNDACGHLAGDRCLRSVAEVLHQCRKGPRDFVGRFGGEEFLFLALNLNEDESVKLAENLRYEVEALQMQRHDGMVSPYITVSVGIRRAIPTLNDRLVDNLELADKALYKAKQQGRNRIAMIN